ncbi:MAG TPA: Stk1 family PASTA domain-containing Ser/Thr kinase, partial [Actinotalea caeni]
MLAGRYEVGELIGRGGMAEVHIGRDTRLGRTVAIKVLRSDLARDPTFQARFRREAQSAASLNHPAIVSVYDTGEDTGVDATGNETHVPFIVMEYVEGHTVRDLLRDGAALPIDEAIEITAGVLSALEYSHRAGIVHRDIKPANVMIADDGSVKVMDFGIARAVADTSATMTQTQAVMGTAQYLSPEQAQGQTVDARSDLYSTGCMLFELLTGRAPFIGESPVSIAYQHVGEKPPLASDFAPHEISNELDAVVLHSLEKRRDDRYQDATSFRSDLQSARMGRAVSAAAWTGLERYRRELGSPVTDPNGATAVAAAAAAGAGVGAAQTEVYSTVTGGNGAPPTEVVGPAVGAAGGRPVAYRQGPDTSTMVPLDDEDDRRRGGMGWLWGALAALALVAAACGGDDDATDGDEPPAATDAGDDTAAEPGTTDAPDATSSPDDGDAAAPSGTLRIGVATNVQSYDPQMAAVAQEYYLHPVYDTLVHAEPDGSYVPGLAEEWEWVDNTTLVLSIRPGVTFSDGEPVDAAAVAANFERGVATEASPSAGFYANIESVEVVDDLAVQLNLVDPTTSMLDDLSRLPGMMMSPASFEGDP